MLVNSIIYYKLSKIFYLNVHHVTTLNVTLSRPPFFNKVELPNLEALDYDFHVKTQKIKKELERIYLIGNDLSLHRIKELLVEEKVLGPKGEKVLLEN